jgi:hypothetical protein
MEKHQQILTPQKVPIYLFFFEREIQKERQSGD